jgi:hypothetical protein
MRYRHASKTPPLIGGGKLEEGSLIKFEHVDIVSPEGKLLVRDLNLVRLSTLAADPFSAADHFDCRTILRCSHIGLRRCRLVRTSWSLGPTEPANRKSCHALNEECSLIPLSGLFSASLVNCGRFTTVD